MNTQAFERKLTAILSADVQGYSRLMGEDEDATIRTLTAYRELMSTLIQKHRGRVVDSPGDNLLAEFLSVVDAVRCAVEIQEELRVRNDELPENRRMEFRIGINLGDVVAEGERIYGDGVNIAARVEGLAEGGGICISGTVYDSIKNKLSLSYESLGEHTVKNIKEPIRVYRMRIGPEAAAPVIRDEKTGPRRWQKSALAAVALLVVVAGAWVIWHFYLRPSPTEVKVASEETPAPELAQKASRPVPDEPSIAVLPFANISGDPKEDYLCDGITENIITALSKTPRMLVIARNSVFTYKGKPVMVQQVSEELGVRYVLEGSVQKSGDRLRVTAQLIDAKTGNHIWSDRYDREMKDLFDLQDEIAIKVLDGVRLKIGSGEKSALHWPRVTNNLAAYLKVLKASEHYDRYNKNDNEIVQQLCHEAISLDPKYSAPYAMLAWSHLDACTWGWSKDWKECFTRCFEFAQKAISLNEFDSRAYIALSIYYGMKKQYDKGVSAGAKAVEIEPNGANTNMVYALSLVNAGRHDEAIEKMKKAIRLNPVPPVWYSWISGVVLFRAGHYEEAIPKMKEALRVVGTPPKWFFGVLGGSYWRTGQYDEAIAAYKKALDIDPNYLAAHEGLAISYSLAGP
jgi:adenylate cyclase